MVVRAPDSARDFAALALSVLLDHVGTTADELSRLRAELLAAPGDGSTSAVLGLSQASVELERQGFLFGLLARELGSDVLFERRERHGLECALWLVHAILAREEIDMLAPTLPELDASDEQCTTICAVVARCVHAAHLDDPRTRWRFDSSGGETALCFEGEPGVLLDRALRDGALRLSGARLCRERQGVQLFLPAQSAIWS